MADGIHIMMLITLEVQICIIFTADMTVTLSSSTCDFGRRLRLRLTPDMNILYSFPE